MLKANIGKAIAFVSPSAVGKSRTKAGLKANCVVHPNVYNFGSCTGQFLIWPFRIVKGFFLYLCCFNFNGMYHSNTDFVSYLAQYFLFWKGGIKIWLTIVVM